MKFRRKFKRLKKTKFLVMAVILLIILGGSVGYVLTRPANAEIGNLQIFKGSAQIISNGSAAAGFTGSPVHVTDEIKVAQDGIAAIILKDTTIVRLEGGTDAVVGNLSYQGGKLKDALFKLTSGRLWSRVQPLQDGSHFAVETPTVTAAVRGTSFNTTFKDKITGIYVYHHAVNVTLNSTGGQQNVNQTKLLQMHEGSLQTDFSKGSALPPDGFFDDWIKFNQAQDDLLCQQRHDIPGDCGESVPSLTQPKSTTINQTTNTTTPNYYQPPTQTTTPNPAPVTLSKVTVVCEKLTYYTYQCNATAMYSDDTTKDVTTSASWYTSGEGEGTIQGGNYSGYGGEDVWAIYNTKESNHYPIPPYQLY